MADRKGLLLRVAFIAALSAGSAAHADPWARAGDLALRHDLRLLADAGLVTSPANTWPVPWATIAHDLDANSAREPADPAVAGARARMLTRINQIRNLSGLQPNARVAARTDDFWLRTFEDTPRDGAEARIGVSWMGNRFAARAQVSYADDPLPGDNEWRGDGSYLAGTFGNHIVNVGALDRWWGPSWNDTLLLSSNARPVRGVTFERNVAYAFENKWLAWIGPWRYTLFAGQLGSDSEPRDASLLGFRLDVRPFDSLEIGLTRTAQWCGDDRPCSARTLGNLIIGRDNRGSSGIAEENEPGNQLAGVDFRWQAPLVGGPWAVYAQAVGEDEAGGLPSKFFGQAGLEAWGGLGERWPAGSWRAHLEYTNTTVRFLQNEPEYNTAYEHSIYRSGYRYQNRALGAAADGDSELVSLGVTVIDDRAHSWNGLVRVGDINQRGAGAGRDALHTVSPDELRIAGAQLSHRRAIGRDGLELGTLSVGVGVQYSDNRISGASDTDAQAFLQWTWDYSGL
ncbi:MAG: capsule assembly Wzi family protein [Pseudomonadales bacterium]|nr:capsule assembly Wzi family protein [Pseudomonadales bacterium]